MTPIEQQLLRLVRAGLHPRQNFLSDFPVLPSDAWRQLYALASRQGVTAIAGDGMPLLAADRQPGRELRIEWALQTERLERRAHEQHQTAGELAAMFAAHGMRMLLLKGPGLGAYYTTPAHRECGDLDIWLFGQYEAANRLLRQAGAKVTGEVPKHTGFVWKGVRIENHRTFLNIRRNVAEKELDDMLRRMVGEQEKELDDMLRGMVGGPENSGIPGHKQRPTAKSTDTRESAWLVPPPLFNAVYLIRHASRHFLDEGIALRHLCDWACFLEKETAIAQDPVFSKVMNQYGMQEFAALTTAAAACYLGIEAPQPASDEKQLGRFMSDMFAYGMREKPRTPLARIGDRIYTPVRNRWRFDLLHTPLHRYYRDTARAQWNEKFTLLG